ncbi:exodeoxyribonuclease VII large subunit [Paenibacillus ihumii]|uniref:exodeoxyribonuclease VII large subunit n=1 Tax=Paenibacillus ihumii TaxID=687436 RepID=UPI000ACDFD13|nr:exodeoxyribonuclease VII large subunit [Paenibacillus ihumii]
MEQKIYTIKELNRYIRMKMESDTLLSEVWIRGEISNFTHHSSGHMYFTLKDKDSRIKSIMFASHNQRLPFIPREGTRVIARGNVSVYERDGQYQFYATQMQPDGIGSLYLAFEQLKQKLEAEGLFAPQRKRPLPAFPRVIGVITSPTGAAVRDILTTLERRYPQARVVLHPVLVQGKGAAPSIVQAIRTMNALGEADVLIVGRGGGSLEELWAFNEEAVARSIYESAIPVISAVGHETDFTIADFVADLRAATPTAAAELRLHQRLLRYHPQDTLALTKRRHEDAGRLLRAAMNGILKEKSQTLSYGIRQLDALSPLKVMARGYSLVYDEKGRRLVKSLNDVEPGDLVRVKLTDGELDCQVWGMRGAGEDHGD